VKIGLYFGSFNPIHTGHLIIAQHLMNFAPLDRLWFVVSPQNPLKKSESLLNENHRKQLIDLAIEGETKLRSSNIEFKLPKPSFTSDTLAYLSDLYPNDQFSVVMGSDSFTNIKRWKNYEVILKSYEIYIFERPGFKVNSELLPKSVTVLKAPLLQISSTYIRKLIKENKSIRYLVPDIVLEEIIAQQYYR
jgi:nicotinate-nucleotide adenylyltransferase